MTDQQSGQPDRQQHLRDRLVEVERLLAKAVGQVESATSKSIATADKLEKQRQALRQAEKDHSDALWQLEAADGARLKYEGELATVNRRLEMASIVREART